MTTTMSDYAYIHTRIRFMEGDLLTADQLRRLLSFRELSAAVTYLKKTPYRLYFSEGIEGALIDRIDTALRTAISSTIQKIYKIFKGEDILLLEILLGRWDVFNIKTLIRGKLHNVVPQEVLSSTIPAGRLDEGTLKEVYKQPSVQTMVDMLFTIGFTYAAPLRRLEYLQEGDLFKGEIGLERAFFRHLLRRLKAYDKRGINRAMVEDTVERLIDRYNLMAAVKVAGSGIQGIQINEAEAWFIDGGKVIRPELYKKILRGSDLSQSISMIDHATWKSHWDQFYARTRITDPLLRIERWLDYEMLTYAIRLPRKDPFNIGLVISYLWRKINEVMNLRILLRGIHYNLPQGEIEGLLMLPGP
ncbi:MAG: V-type ATPase subunit [Nitrospirae bacterium]|nr:V-type ATPase subunit [Nitrospirota bacterium]